jgi:hypothetical protein
MSHVQKLAINQHKLLDLSEFEINYTVYVNYYCMSGSDRRSIGFLGVPEVWAANLLRSRTNTFCFFFWKKKNTIS